MSSKKITVSRKWLAPVPTIDGKKIPKSDWPEYRRYCWIVRWYSTTGKRHGKLFEKKREAERFALKLQELVNSRKQDEPEKVHLKDFIAEHKKLMKNQVGDATLVDHIRALKQFEVFLGTGKQLRKITPKDAEAFIASRLQQNLSIATINKDIRTLKRVFNLAIEPRGYLREGQNPFAKIKQRKITPKTVQYLTTQEYHALIESSSTFWWKAFLSVAYCCGLRRGEILNLTWADVDFINQLVHVRAKEKGKTILAWEPKTHENRSVPMPEETSQHLANFQAEIQEGFPYVFIGPERFEKIKHLRDHGKWTDIKAIRNNLNRDFEVIRKRSGIAKCTLHDLRRSAITNWAQALPIQAVQQFAGHSNITTTKKYYLAVRQDDIEKAGVFLNQLLARSKRD